RGVGGLVGHVAFPFIFTAAATIGGEASTARIPSTAYPGAWFAYAAAGNLDLLRARRELAGDHDKPVRKGRASLVENGRPAGWMAEMPGGLLMPAGNAGLKLSIATTIRRQARTRLDVWTRHIRARRSAAR